MTIDLQTRDSIFDWMKAQGYSRKLQYPRSYQDYDNAKKCWQNSDQYFEICQWISSYLKI